MISAEGGGAVNISVLSASSKKFFVINSFAIACADIVLVLCHCLPVFRHSHLLIDEANTEQIEVHELLMLRLILNI